ncbi:MAG TPA: N-carbamoyl-D-amino-acid hydrolase [Geminicoccaceae bacterium]|jgi:predicted amidohydrolase|nr:N-carbamoyl-D-amino-acid hydrolase [Geminicoccaceae bacterium]
MSRKRVVAAAQLGPIARSESREQVVKRLLALLAEARGKGVGFIVFPELALTTFFPRWMMEDEAELDSFYEGKLPGPAAEPLFDAAKAAGIGFYLGYAERFVEAGRVRRFNAAITVAPTGEIVGKYRKVHLPGHAEPQPNRAFQHLEKRYFEPGDLGFPVFEALGGRVGMLICNDRRWPEGYRVMGLQGVELVCLGYNTPLDHANHETINVLSGFHNALSMQAGAYQNASWVIGTAKCGREEGSLMLADSMIIAPSGEIVARATTMEDELVAATIDLDMGLPYKETFFDFARHREPTSYGLIIERKGAGDMLPPARGAGID